MKRAIIYARVSSDDRDKEGSGNLGSQIDACRNHCRAKGYTIIAELQEDDRGASGADWQLPELNHFLDLADSGAFDVLVCRNVARLARDAGKAYAIHKRLTRQNITLDFVAQSFSNDPAGKAMFGMTAIFADWEKDEITLRTSRRRRELAQMGHVVQCSKVPYGFRRARVDGLKKLIAHEPEAKIVRMVFDWYTKDNLSYQTIADKLTEMHVSTWADINDAERTITRKGSGKSRHKHGEWPKSTVARMLSSRLYRGEFVYASIIVPIEPIISTEQWEQAHARRQSNIHTMKRNQKHEYLLSGRCLCGTCGCRAYGHTNTYDKVFKTQQYYRCASKRRLDYKKCDSPSFHVEQVDAGIWQWIKDQMLDPAQIVETMRDRQSKRDEINKPLIKQLAVIDELLQENQTKLERLVDLYLDGVFGKDVIVERRTRLEKTIQSLQGERANIAAQLDAKSISDTDIETVFTLASEVAKRLPYGDKHFAERAKIIAILNVKVALFTDNDIKKARITCELGEDIVALSSKGCSTSGRKGNEPIVLTGIIVLEPNKRVKIAA